MATIRVADSEAAQAYLHENGFTDGLPVVPPTRDRVEAMLAGGTLPPDTELGAVEGRNHSLTVEQAAVCAVMAGALPEYFPVILATWEAIFDPEFNASAVLGSSGGTAITCVVSGPYAARIEMNAGANLLGSGNRANATIGRSIRLGLRNALHYRTGELDGAAFGNPARYTSHFAEEPPPPPWRPLTERLGFRPGTTTVTVAPTDAPRQLAHILSGDSSNVLAAVATCMRDLSHVAAARTSMYYVVLGPEHAHILRTSGWDESTICAHLAEITRMTPEEVEAAGIPVENGVPAGFEDAVLRSDGGTLPTTSAEDIVLVTAGGAGAGWSQVIYGYAPAYVFRHVTKEVLWP